MKWEEYKNLKEPMNYYATHIRTDIECPKCGAYIYKDISIVYTSNPPKYKFNCFNCNWSGYK